MLGRNWILVQVSGGVVSGDGALPEWSRRVEIRAKATLGSASSGGSRKEVD